MGDYMVLLVAILAAVNVFGFGIIWYLNRSQNHDHQHR